MSHSQIISPLIRRVINIAFSLPLWLAAATAFGQTQQSNDARDLPPNQILEREMTGAETHRYKFDLKANEFFQVRVEQKGVDVALKLSDASGNKLATMDSPNGKEGPEALSFVATVAGNYTLEVSGFDAKAEKGNYTIRREASRTATTQDRRRVEAERLYAEAIELADEGSAESLRKSLPKFSEARSLYQGIGDNQGEADCLEWLGKVHSALGEKQKALEFYSLAIPLRRAGGDLAGQATTFNNIGAIYDDLGEKQKALESYNQALRLRRAVGDRGGEARTLNNIGSVYAALGENQKAIEFYSLALPLRRAIGDKIGETRTLNNIGRVYAALGENQKALDFYGLALPLSKAVGDRGGEAVILNNFGLVYSTLGEKRKALEFYNLALPLYKAVGDRRGVATTLNNIGLAYSALGEKQKALEFYNLALPRYRAFGDKGGEATTLNNIGVVYSALGEKQKALEFYSLALPLRREVGDRRGQATTVNNIGRVYDEGGDKQKALEFYNLALLLYQAVSDKRGEATTLNNIGLAYAVLGEKRRALEFYNLALPLISAVGDRGGQAATLNNIGLAYAALGEKQRALESYNQALLLMKAVGDRGSEAITINNVGLVYAALGEKQKALEFYNQALPLTRAVSDRSSEARTLNNIGSVYAALGGKQEALEFFNLALPLWKAVGDRVGESKTLSNVMNVWESLNSRRMAIFYGKQSVNKYQELRQAIQGLDKETQKTYLKEVEPTYRKVVGILITENRLDEATQVINLLRDEEFFDFNRDLTQPPRQPALTGHESATLSIWQAALEKVIGAEQPLTTLKRNIGNRQANSDETIELKRLETDVEKATANYQTTLKSIETDFNQPASAKDKAENVLDTRDMQAALSQLSTSTNQKTATLYTLIGDDKFHIILIQPNGDTKSFESPINAVDLNKKILQFYAVLQSPAYDPRPLGKQLYDIIFKPVEAELKKAGVQTVMWQLDGNLRYLPMAALFDGDKYLVERFQNVVFTRADKERMTRAVTSNWTGTGFGSSKAYTVDLLGDGTKVNFDALPGVTAELASIFGTTRSNGILKGNVFTDAEFTKNAFYEAMKQHRPLVHISSHFAFRPGDDSRSFLLLGDGTALTLNELKNQTRLFDGVELLTLSACNTALQKANANGREIDGFAELAQRLGAGAVIATLWSVSDNSTPYLMSDFYRVRQRLVGTTKAAAMREAQLALLKGTARVKPESSQASATKGTSNVKLQVVLVPPASQSSQGPRRDTNDVVYVNQSDAPPYHKDAAKPYSHPYYWSPFVLFGNWR